jgi:hypothetical protein
MTVAVDRLVFNQKAAGVLVLDLLWRLGYMHDLVGKFAPDQLAVGVSALDCRA